MSMHGHVLLPCFGRQIGPSVVGRGAHAQMGATVVPGVQLAVAEVAENPTAAAADGALGGYVGGGEQTAVVEGTVVPMHRHPNNGRRR